MYMYIHVHVVMYLYVHGIKISVPCSDTYVPFCPILSRWVGFQMWIYHVYPPGIYVVYPWIYIVYHLTYIHGIYVVYPWILLDF